MLEDKVKDERTIRKFEWQDFLPGYIGAFIRKKRLTNTGHKFDSDMSPDFYPEGDISSRLVYNFYHFMTAWCGVYALAYTVYEVIPHFVK